MFAVLRLCSSDVWLCWLHCRLQSLRSTASLCTHNANQCYTRLSSGSATAEPLLSHRCLSYSFTIWTDFQSFEASNSSLSSVSSPNPSLDYPILAIDLTLVYYCGNYCQRFGTGFQTGTDSLSNARWERKRLFVIIWQLLPQNRKNCRKEKQIIIETFITDMKIINFYSNLDFHCNTDSNSSNIICGTALSESDLKQTFDSFYWRYV